MARVVSRGKSKEEARAEGARGVSGVPARQEAQVPAGPGATC
jgi:hypothetical protein